MTCFSPTIYKIDDRIAHSIMNGNMAKSQGWKCIKGNAFY